MTNHTRTEVWLEGKRRLRLGRLVKSGGAGSVFLLPESPNQVAKLYHPQQDMALYLQKLQAMLRLSPDLPDQVEHGKSFVQIAWPQALLYDARGQPLGFVMPLLDIQKTAELEQVMQERQARAAGLPVGLGAKITLAANLCAVIAALHQQRHYVIDLKPVNLRFYRDSLYIAMLDCDGFSIQGTDTRFPAQQYTPDYLAPELQSAAPNAMGEAQDRFALAVVVFQLLNFGIHPFSGRPLNPRVPTDIPGRISGHYYAYGLSSHKAIAPNPTSGHALMPVALRKLFDRAFAGAPSTRPVAAEWAQVLREYARRSSGQLQACTANPEHQHFANLACAACARDVLIAGAAKIPKQKKKKKKAKGKAPLTQAYPTVLHTTASPTAAQTMKAILQAQAAKPATTVQPRVAAKGSTAAIALVLVIAAVLVLSMCMAPANRNPDTQYSYSTPEIAQSPPPRQWRSDGTEEWTVSDTRMEIERILRSASTLQSDEYGLAKSRLIQSFTPPKRETIARYKDALDTSEFVFMQNHLPNVSQFYVAQEDHLALDPRNFYAAAVLGRRYLAKNELFAARRHFEQALWANPRHTEGWLGLAGLALRSDPKDVQQAVAYLAIDQVLSNQEHNPLSSEPRESRESRIAWLESEWMFREHDKDDLKKRALILADQLRQLPPPADAAAEVEAESLPKQPLRTPRGILSGKEAVVILTVSVDILGKVNQITVSSSSGSSFVDINAINIAKRFRYRPAISNGRLQEHSTATVRLTFVER